MLSVDSGLTNNKTSTLLVRVNIRCSYRLKPEIKSFWMIFYMLDILFGLFCNSLWI